ncbi:uncharacterized protein LOC123296430 [Chrysoperla carnea]|uniref:uncharacterized protein LOC123296430 n=1 Tax=Chrysoperla carnea TaxID=189513 RepID=UPI001D05CD01|nr:uncharacterized protein LOC123296430 [Chrysoperla carnea]
MIRENFFLILGLIFINVNLSEQWKINNQLMLETCLEIDRGNNSIHMEVYKEIVKMVYIVCNSKHLNRLNSNEKDMCKEVEGLEPEDTTDYMSGNNKKFMNLCKDVACALFGKNQIYSSCNNKCQRLCTKHENTSNCKITCDHGCGCRENDCWDEQINECRQN